MMMMSLLHHVSAVSLMDSENICETDKRKILPVIHSKLSHDSSSRSRAMCILEDSNKIEAEPMAWKHMK